MQNRPERSICRWVYHEDGTADLIPECWASVTSGPGACTCGAQGSGLDHLQAEVDRLQYRLRWAMDRLEVRRHESEDQRFMIRHWIGVLRDHGIEPWRHNPPDETLRRNL